MEYHVDLYKNDNGRFNDYLVKKSVEKDDFIHSPYYLSSPAFKTKKEAIGWWIMLSRNNRLIEEKKIK